MVVSSDTANAMLEVFLKYVDRSRVNDLLRDLKRITGNQSYQQTIARIEQILREEEKK